MGLYGEGYPHTVKWDGAPVLFTSETPSDYPLPVSLSSF